MAVGTSGRIIASDDLGRTWRNLTSNATNDYYSITWTGTHLLASGVNGLTSQSGDGGETWETYYFNGQFFGCAGLGGTWLLVGTSGRIIATFDNGDNWFTMREVSGAPALRDIIFTGEVFIAVGDNGTILRGTKPETLVPIASGTTAHLFDVVQVGSSIVASGGREFSNHNQLQTIVSSLDDGLTWSSRFTGIGGSVEGVAGSGSNLVAVGHPDFIAKSSNGGTTWAVETKALTAPSFDIHKMIHTDGLIVGVGTGGKINTSSDGGRNWVVRSSGTTRYLYDIFRTGNRLTTIGEAGTLLTSDDNGATWISRGFGESGFLLGMADTGSTLVLVGTTSTLSAPRAYYSTDQGTTWISASVPPGGFLYAAEWTGSSLVAVGGNGEIMTSGDEGRTWSKRTSGSTSTLLDVVAGPGCVIATGSDQTILRSTDNGVTWQAATKSPKIFGSITNLEFDGSTCYAMSWMGLIHSKDSGVTWEPRNHYITDNSVFVHDGNGLILANTSLDEVYTSDDGGESWIGVNVLPIRHTNSITKKRNRLVAVGDVGQIMTSDDGGTNWKIWSVELIFSDLHDIDTTPTGFVTVGERGQLFTSTNGQQWTDRSLPGVTADMNGVAYGGGRVVAVGAGGSALVSLDDGSTWTAVTTGSGVSLLGVTYGNGQFVAVGESGVILTSANGEAWIQRASGVTQILTAVDWTGSRYIAVGSTALNSSGGGVILSSENGITWTTRASNLSDPPLAIESIGTRVVVVGSTHVGISDNGGLNWVINPISLTFFRAVHWEGKTLLAAGSNNNLWKSEGNAEGLAALGLIPNLEIRDPDGQLLVNGAGMIDFASVMVGETGEASEIEITNSGTAPLTGFSVIPSAATAVDFVLDVSTLELSLAPGESSRFTVSFKPSSSGVRSGNYTISSNDPDEPEFAVAVSGEGYTPEDLFDDAMGDAGLTESDALANAAPFGDGVPNLLKYAFNMDLTGPDTHSMVPSGESGLPILHIVAAGNNRTWKFEYVRRQSSGLLYEPQWSPSLADGTFQPLEGADQQVNFIDETWERVTHSMPILTESPPTMFVRVRVGFPPASTSATANPQ